MRTYKKRKEVHYKMCTQPPISKYRIDIHVYTHTTNMCIYRYTHAHNRYVYIDIHTQ